MTKTENNTLWTAADELLLLNFLRDHAAAAGDGGNFKLVTFTAAGAVLELKCTKGGPKTAKACQNKWTQVHIDAHTGWSWSDETGASITPDMEMQWVTFLKTHKDAKPFKNHGWVQLINTIKFLKII
ncbi:hypothetical protein BDQ12DRAFT_595635 [Crucibulum laeve]|uniref:Myb/SANT-like domain-containing protein n=1 Tax=Crucibulum laeve TaxID=68775 RepID=A0A5C3MF22_9AGAR|nr:hypothetical protein BDQ12DRAFT_595635 [Crucibulum laeve]